MNELDPKLKQLLKWVHEGSPPAPVDAPFGFVGRVIASRKYDQPMTLLEELQRIAWGIACASLALLVCGTVVLFSQRASPAPEPEISSALNFVANSLLQ